MRSSRYPVLCASKVGVLSGGRIGAASLLLSSPSQSSLASTRRFASTESTTPSLPAAETTPSPEPEISTLYDFDAPSVLNIPEGVGYLSRLGLDYGYGPTSLCEWVVEHLHFTMGLGWLGAIVGGALAIRAVMVYPALIAQYQSTRSQEMRKDPVYQDRQAKFMLAIANRGGDPTELMQLRMQIKYLQEKYGVKPYKMGYPMLQLPLAYGMFKLSHGMSKLPVPGLENAGVLWFPDLTVPDSMYILPCVGVFTMYLSVKRTLPFMASEQASMMKYVPFVLGPIGFFVTLGFPAAVQVYFAAAAFLQYLQTVIWHIPFVRRICKLPPLHSTIINPDYQDVAASRFANRHGTYQPPRTVSTTATEHKNNNQPEAEETDKGGLKSPLAMFRDASKQVSEKISKYQKSAADKEKETADKFERARAQAENDKYMARKAKAERMLAQKKAGKK